MERPRKHSPIATLALALLCAFTLAACGGSTSAESVAGTVWQLTAISVEGDGAVADCTAEEYLAENGIEYRLEFPDDSSAALVRTQYSGRFGSEAITDLGYTLSGNRLSFTARNEAVFETVSFDGSTLVLRFDDARGTVTTFTFEKTEVEEAPEEPATEEGAPEEQPADDAAAAEEAPQEEAFVEDALEDDQTVQVPCGVIATVPRLYAGRGARWVAYDEGMNLEVPNDGIRVVANIDWSERAEHSSEAKEEKWLIGTAIYNGMKRDVWLHIPYVGAGGNPLHWNSPEESDVLACERWLAVEGDVVRSWISIYTGVGAITAPTGVSERTTPFWGVWASASQDLNEALAFARDADTNGFAVEVFLTTDWDNLNSSPWYVVTLGCPDSEGAAQTLLAQAQDAGYSDAYIKYSGSYIG